MDSPLLAYKKTLITLLLVAVALIVPLFLYLTLPQFAAYVERVVFGISYESRADWGTLDGRLRLSLAPLHEDVPVSVYELLIGASVPRKIAADGGSYYGPRTSPDGDFIAYTAYDSGKYRLRLISSDLEEPYYVDLSPHDSRVTRLAHWSMDSDRVTFMARSDLEGDDMAIDSWGTYVSTVAEPDRAQLVTQGMYPLFLSDGSLVVLKQEGLYRAIEVAGIWEGEIVLPLIEGNADASMQLMVSDDRTRLAWTNPTRGMVEIFRVDIDEATEVVTFTKIDELHTKGRWPVFSPDRRYLALVEGVYDQHNPDEQKLVAYDLNSGEKQLVADLAAYATESLIVTEWLPRESL